jgi:hypothetical protein
MDLQFAVHEFEEEEDIRNLIELAKTTKPLPSGVQHSLCACIANETTLHQKHVKKLFPQTLKECESLLVEGYHRPATAAKETTPVVTKYTLSNETQPTEPSVRDF